MTKLPLCTNLWRGCRPFVHSSFKYLALPLLLLLIVGCLSLYDSQTANDQNSSLNMLDDIHHQHRLSDLISINISQMKSSTNVLSFHDYMHNVYHQREATAKQIWASLSEPQKHMMSCTDFEPSADLKQIARVDYEPGPYNYDTNYKNPCWWEPFTMRIPYNVDAYINSVKIKDYFTKMKKHWQEEKQLEKPRDRLRCVPLVYIVGTGKCGSTDLYSTLVEHHSISSAPEKEPRWWIRTRIGKRGRWHPVSTYIDLYDGEAVTMTKRNISDRVIVDASVGTMYITDRWMLYPGNEGLRQPRVINAHHLRAMVPHAKIVILLREPVSRLYSHYNEDWQDSATPLGFHNEVEKALSKMQKCLDYRPVRECVYDPCVNNAGTDRRIKLRSSMYSIFITDWLKVFPRDQVRFYTLEEYKRDRMNVMDNITSFLQIDGLSPRKRRYIKQKEIVRPSSYRPMLRMTRKLLEIFIWTYNQQLEQILPGDQRFAFNQMYNKEDT